MIPMFHIPPTKLKLLNPACNDKNQDTMITLVDMSKNSYVFPTHYNIRFLNVKYSFISVVHTIPLNSVYLYCEELL